MIPETGSIDARHALVGRAAAWDAETVAEALGARKEGPKQWKARCPFHTDSTASLSISEGAERRVLVHCHAGCDHVFERLVTDGHFGDTAPSRAAREPDAIYKYMDESGALAYEVVRLPGKEFRARRLGELGEWIWNLPPELRLPYRLPELLGAPDDARIFVVEGEKDTDALAARGYVATTNPFGAGKGKWLPQYNQHFAGRHIIIVPDNDEAGREHAEQVHQQLEPVAASVRVMSLKGAVKEKGDVSDLIDAEGVEAFERLLEKLPQPVVNDRPYLRIEDLANRPRRRWLVEGLVPQQGFALLYGDSGVGKTFVAIDMGVRIAAGESAFDRRVVAGLVFYVALEGQSGLCDRVRAVSDDIGVLDVGRLPLAVGRKPLDLSSPESVSDLVSATQRASDDYKTPAALVVIDTLSRAMPGANENSPEDMNRAVNAVARIQKETGAAVLVIHHSGKTVERGARGHSSLRAAVDAELLVSKEARGTYLKVTKQREGADDIKIPFELATKTVPLADGSDTVETRVVRVLQLESTAPKSRLRPGTSLALKALKEALRVSGSVLSVENAERLSIPRGVRVITRDEWTEACRKAGLSTANDEALRKARSRAAKELRDAGMLEDCGDYVWLKPEGHRTPPGQVADSGTGQDSPGPVGRRKGKARASRDRTGHPPIGVSVCPARDSPSII